MADNSFTAYLAAEGFTHLLIDELGSSVKNIHERLVLAEGPPRSALWADNIWLNPRFIPITSIGDAAQKLRSLQRNWAHYGFDFHRRSQLIAEKLPHVSARPIRFPSPLPTAPLGSWTLVDPDMLLASPSCSSPYPNGAYIFVENKDEAPSRAYLKLWEILTRLQKYPTADETCVDLGASPGGWTWALHGLGANVVSVDKAPLAPAVAALPRVRCLEESAFALAPERIGPVDWLFSDIICYPDKALRLMERWKKSGYVRNIVSTVKFQGETDYAIIQKFMDIPGSQAVHLFHNKHEITWLNIQK